jgi:hypothetical protein
VDPILNAPSQPSADCALQDDDLFWRIMRKGLAAYDRRREEGRRGGLRSTSISKRAKSSQTDAHPRASVG